jgi:ABC-type phosphate transport system auxiliary subunit
VSDFETVRKALYDYAKNLTEGIALAALDRIEAEVERLREQDEVHWKTRQHLVTEVERLREELRLREASQIPVIPKAVQVEVERLQRQLDNLLDERGETPYVAEVERLNAYAAVEARDHEAHHAGIERLRAAGEALLFLLDGQGDVGMPEADYPEGFWAAVEQARNALAEEGTPP